MFDSPGAHKPKRSPSICSTSTSPCNSDPWVVGPLFNHMLRGCNYLSCCRSPWMVQGIHCRPDRSSRHPRFFQGVCKPRKTAHRWLWEKQECQFTNVDLRHLLDPPWHAGIALKTSHLIYCRDALHAGMSVLRCAHPGNLSFGRHDEV